MKYLIKHVTAYKYASRVSHCYNLAQMIPRTTQRQTCINSKIEVTPELAMEQRREDYFGNQVFQFEIQRPHKALTITATSQVETRPQIADTNLDLGSTCAEVLSKMQQSKSEDVLLAREYQLDSSMIAAAPEFRDYAADLFTADRSLLSACFALTARIYEEFSYSPLATTIATPLSEVMQNKKGVCQDFAHLQIACLRSLGFAAKYVSGYLETLPPPGQEKLVGADATHAWLSVFSPGEGWVEFDPTNNCLAGEQHIITAWGRDFNDVTPLKGVIFGGGSAPEMTVSVDVSRV